MRRIWQDFITYIAPFMNEPNAKIIRASSIAGQRDWIAYLITAKWPRAVVAACGMALLLSASTALGTASLPFFGRTAYWLVEMLLGAGVIGVILWLIRKVPRRRLYLRTALVALIGAPLITVVVWLTTEPIKGEPLRWERTLTYLPGVLPVTGFNAFMQIMLGRRELALGRAEIRSPVAASRADPDPEIYAIEAQAHYVVLHTSQGPVKKLMRLYDAIATTSQGAKGIQIHRSWWISLSAVASFDERKRTVVLKTGLEAPVSRARINLIKETFRTLA